MHNVFNSFLVKKFHVKMLGYVTLGPIGNVTCLLSY